MGLFSKVNLEIATYILSAILIVIVSFSFGGGHQITHQLSEHVCIPNSSHRLQNINDSTVKRGGLLSASGNFYPPNTYWTSPSGTTWGCPCLVKPCIHKCFDKIEMTNDFEGCNGKTDLIHQPQFNFSTHTVYKKLSKAISPVHVTVNVNHFYIIEGCRCKEKDVDISKLVKPNNNYLIQEDGTLVFLNNSLEVHFNYNKFCIPVTSQTSKINFKLCTFDKSFNNVMLLASEGINTKKREHSIPPWWLYLIRVSCMFISIPCLLFTLFVYTLLPQLRNLHGKALMCYVASLIVVYFSLALVITGNPGSHGTFCKAIAFTIQFSVLTSFFWLNVMCFDIWWAFSGLRLLQGSRRSADRAKFSFYSCYAWGAPLVIVSVSVFMDNSSYFPSTVIKPNMGISKCFFKEDAARVMYLYLPVGVLVYLNIAMFLATAIRVRLHSSATQALQGFDSRRHRTTAAPRSPDDVQRFGIYLKLSAMMGVSWVLELLSSYVGGHPVLWLVTDAANALHGVLVLWLSVMGPRTVRLLRQRLRPSIAVTTTRGTPARAISRTAVTTTHSAKCQVFGDCKSTPV